MPQCSSWLMLWQHTSVHQQEALQRESTSWYVHAACFHLTYCSIEQLEHSSTNTQLDIYTVSVIPDSNNSCDDCASAVHGG